MLSFGDIIKVMQNCVEIGYVKGQCDMLPKKGYIRRQDAEDLLRRNGLKKIMLTRWVDNGLLEEKRGEKNSPLQYPLTGLLEIITSIKLNEIQKEL